MGSSFVTHSSGSFSGLSAAGGTSGGTSSPFIKGRFVSAPAAGLAENQSALHAMSRDARKRTAIQRLVLRQDPISRELFKRAIATAFTQFACEIRRFDQRVQAGSGSDYIAERVQRT